NTYLLVSLGGDSILFLLIRTFIYWLRKRRNPVGSYVFILDYFATGE
ncbi:MAG: hypothetical protein ACI9E1_000371, partial [Cryomorphaceae bacterium]